jgi:hypothetical protein
MGTKTIFLSDLLPLLLQPVHRGVNQLLLFKKEMIKNSRKERADQGKLA